MTIDIENLTKTIKGVTVLDDISLRLEGGKIYGLRGKNGSGKTMLMRAVCGLIYPSSGKISIDGEVIGKDISFPQSVGALIENPSFLGGYSGYKNLEMLAQIKGKIGPMQIKNALSSVGLDPEDTRKYRKYSLGMKQRLGIVCAVMESPGLIVLDEPINALDDNGVELVKTLLLELRDAGALIIVACHDAGELEYLSEDICCKGWMSNPLLKQQSGCPVRSRMRRQARGGDNQIRKGVTNHYPLERERRIGRSRFCVQG